MPVKTGCGTDWKNAANTMIPMRAMSTFLKSTMCWTKLARRKCRHRLKHERMLFQQYTKYGTKHGIGRLMSLKLTFPSLLNLKWQSKKQNAWLPSTRYWKKKDQGIALFGIRRFQLATRTNWNYLPNLHNLTSIMWIHTLKRLLFCMQTVKSRITKIPSKNPSVLSRPFVAS